MAIHYKLVLFYFSDSLIFGSSKQESGEESGQPTDVETEGKEIIAQYRLTTEQNENSRC